MEDIGHRKDHDWRTRPHRPLRDNLDVFGGNPELLDDLTGGALGKGQDPLDTLQAQATRGSVALELGVRVGKPRNP